MSWVLYTVSTPAPLLLHLSCDTCRLMISPRSRTHHLLVVLIMLRVPVLPLTRLHLLALAERLVGLAVAGHLSRYLPFHTQACDESARIAPREHCCTTQPVIHGTRSRHTVTLASLFDSISSAASDGEGVLATTRVDKCGGRGALACHSSHRTHRLGFVGRRHQTPLR